MQRRSRRTFLASLAAATCAAQTTGKGRVFPSVAVRYLRGRSPNWLKARTGTIGRYTKRIIVTCHLASSFIFSHALIAVAR